MTPEEKNRLVGVIIQRCRHIFWLRNNGWEWDEENTDENGYIYKHPEKENEYWLVKIENARHYDSSGKLSCVVNFHADE